MNNLVEAGLREGISEVIVTTQSLSGIPNAAPAGILSQGGEYMVRLYRGSKTLSNVRETMRLAANVTLDSMFFVRTLFGNLSTGDFSLFHGFPVLKEANSWVLFGCRLIHEGTDSLLFLLSPLAVAIIRASIYAINRGLNAVIEAAILASRYDILESDIEREQMMRKMGDYAEIVEKCGGRREKEAMQLLIDELHKRA
ncbi:MAG: DUF447 family protein [Methanophagales archaeon]|nr:DUF447 family protein [Methanophagales archaeon]MCW3137841.1 DUF447 family protein [Methanophagales archaeon]MCW7072667.1 DUF447 family protein [Methanophagales archaeon]RLG35446.1 MAG: DUF447 domain-containing protein [Methanosarcinales archaeon]